MLHRRQILKGAIALPFLGSALLACTSNAEETQNDDIESLNILILGGTSFLGPHQIAYALGRGHKVSTFTRGKTKPTVHADLFDRVTMLIGDRNDDLKAIETGEWDLVIDNSGRNVEWTRKTAQLLKDRAGLYMYTSSTSVYYPYLTEDIKEDMELVTEKPEVMEHDWETMEYDYGIMKTKSEIETIKAFGEDRSIIIRPTYMFGPGDKTDRFIYWPLRLAKGGEILVPGKDEDPIQYLDVRDVAEFMISMAEQKKVGKYNAVGPKDYENMRDFVKRAEKAFDVESSYVYIDDNEFLEENGMPILAPWIPAIGGNFGTSKISNAAALQAGLKLRPVADIVKDTYDWWMSDQLTEENRKAFSSRSQKLLDNEAEVLKKWKAL